LKRAYPAALLVWGRLRRRPARPAHVPRALVALAGIAVVLQALDLITGVQMMATRGLVAELNPLAREAFAQGGALGAAALKFGAVGAGFGLFAALACQGHTRLAGACFAVSAGLGLVGVYSNVA
jgi:hypothetical protein